MSMESECQVEVIWALIRDAIIAANLVDTDRVARSDEEVGQPHPSG